MISSQTPIIAASGFGFVGLVLTVLVASDLYRLANDYIAEARTLDNVRGMTATLTQVLWFTAVLYAVFAGVVVSVAGKLSSFPYRLETTNISIGCFLLTLLAASLINKFPEYLERSCSSLRKSDRSGSR